MPCRRPAQAHTRRATDHRPTVEAIEPRRLLSATPIGLTPTYVPTNAALTLPATILQGGRLRGTVTYGLTDSSAHADLGVNTVRLYAAADGQLDDSAILLQTVRRTLSLQPGQSRTLTVLVHPTAADPLPAGTYTVLAQTTDGAGDVVTAAAGPTLEVQIPAASLSAVVGPPTPAVAGPGRAVALTVVLTNAGNIDATGRLTTTVGLSRDGSTIAYALRPTAARPVRVRGNGRAVSLRLTARLSADVPPGVYRLAVSLTRTATAGGITTTIDEFTTFGEPSLTVTA